MNSLMNKTTMRLCVVVIQIKLEAVLRHYDCENEEPKIRTTIHKLAMIKFYGGQKLCFRERKSL